MNAPQVIGVLACLGMVAVTVLGFEIFVFRAACVLNRVPQPGFLRTVGLVAVLLAVPAVVDAVFAAALAEIYLSAGYPLWEAGLVQFFLALPAHMAICSLIHSQALGVPLGEGLAVWFVDKLLKAVMLLVIVGGVAAVVALGQAGK